MLQESVYCKLALNSTAVNAIVDNVHKNKPEGRFNPIINSYRKTIRKDGYYYRRSEKRGFG